MSSEKIQFRAHESFPLTLRALSSGSLTPEFAYFERNNARRLSALLKASLPPYTAGEFVAAGLLGQVFLHLIQSYLKATPGLYSDLDGFLLDRAGFRLADQALTAALSQFPTTAFYYSPARLKEYTFGSESIPNQRYGLYSSVLLILTADENPFFQKRDGIFTDIELRQSPPFQRLKGLLRTFFDTQPSFQGSGKSLLDLLQEPGQAHPDSLYDQLDYIRRNWSSLLDPQLLRSLLSGLDLIKEEHHPGPFIPGRPGDPLGDMPASYLAQEDLVRFSADQDWMPRVILLAKNIYVWLDQLSRSYQRPIYRLDQIPESEFARMSEWGITALWLIGIWERSYASQQIKQLTGNPDAVPSAYSLYDYSIAASLGGDEGYQALLSLASRYGIRLAADMVPNHMGIFSKWVIEHPEWFLSLDRPPFPNYSYTGPDLSSDPHVEIYLEDHYYDRSDAAVVFKRIDQHGQPPRYIYHGNDGTSMPWNDTAQLDYLNPRVREAVIETILQVARKFPIIRFDAAMTLTKKHYQRLWFPEPGSGGAIPTRSDHGLTRGEFNRHMPKEFWREVVDRVAEEVPDTLLLAEAFWMMEGYFVRSLGMHRVYNSAFMHMLRDEDNQEYRELIIKTLEYDPQILKRYVNFMNNPDEETAISQFGSGGKYFGVCLLMITLPGLPMFGHGQVEGFTEKYGMEYQRAYYDESPNLDLIARHRREIFPLLHKRYLFAEVEHFVLYDLITDSQGVYPDVLAYSNRSAGQCALVIYHNKWAEVTGRIRSSSAINGQRSSLLCGLGYQADSGDFLLFRDHISGQEYIRSLPELESEGLQVSLGAYEYQVFLDFKLVPDPDGSYKALHEALAGTGTPSIEKSRKTTILAPLEKLFNELLSHVLLASSGQNAPRSISPAADLASAYFTAADSIEEKYQQGFPVPSRLELSARLERLENHARLIEKRFPRFRSDLAYLSCFLAGNIPLVQALLESGCFENLAAGIAHQSPGLISDQDIFLQELRAAAALLPDLAEFPASPSALFELFLDNPTAKEYLGINEHEGIVWFNKERLESLIEISLSQLLALWALPATNDQGDEGFVQAIDLISNYATTLQEAMTDSQYQVERLLSLLSNAAQT